MANLLLIDDDKEVLSINMRYFHKEGYTVKATTGGISALKLIPEFIPDCIVLDIMMPGMDGYTVCKKIRELTDAPIIFLTGKSDEEDKIRGFEAGADDYLVKPYSLRELNARIQAMLKRYSNTKKPSPTMLDFSPLSLDIATHKAYYNDEEIPLSSREYELLYYLASRPDEIVTFEELGNAMFASSTDSDRRTVMVTASRLRKKMENYVGLVDVIRTVWSKGYKFSVSNEDKT